MKWVLDIENKNIDMDIRNDLFMVKTEDSEVQFRINAKIAFDMFVYIKAFYESPGVPGNEEIVESIGNKKMKLRFIQVPDDEFKIFFWEMNLDFGNSTFCERLSFEDIHKVTQVLKEYLENVRLPVYVYIRERCPYSSRLLKELEKRNIDYHLRNIDEHKDLLTNIPPVLQTPDNFYVLPDFFEHCDPDLVDNNVFDKLRDDLILRGLDRSLDEMFWD